jgi:hypothetical protein
MHILRDNALSGLGFSLNPKKIAQRHISMVRKAVTRHVSLVKKTAKRHAALVRRPIKDVKAMRTGTKRPSAAGGAALPIQYTDDAGNVIPASELYQYTDDAGNALGPPPAGYVDGSYYDDGGYDDGSYAPPPLDPRQLLTLPASRIRELAESGSLYPGSGITAQALYDRERSLYQSPANQPDIPQSEVDYPSWEPAPMRTVYGVEHTPTNYAALAPPYYGPEAPAAPWMSETEETAWADRDAVYPAASSASDEWGGNAGPSFDEDAYGADSLSGIYDVLIGDPIKFWAQKWQEAKAKLSAALVSVSGTSQTLARIRATIDAAIDATANSQAMSSDDVAALERTRQKLVALENNQATLEGKLTSAAAQVKQTQDDNPDAGLGVFPIVAVGVIVATVIGIVAAVVIHTQNVNALDREVQAVIAGRISATDIAKIQGAGGLPGFGLPDFGGVGEAAGGLAVLAAVGIAAYLLLGKKR